MANSLPGSPIVGFYNEDKEDFGEHDKELVIKNGKVMLKEKTRPYGFVDLNAKVWFAKYLDDNSVEREYLVTEGFLVKHSQRCLITPYTKKNTLKKEIIIQWN